MHSKDFHAAGRPVVFITSYAESLHNFRGDLIREVIARGHPVWAFAPDYTPASRAAIEALGAMPVDIKMERNGLSPLRDLATLFELRRKILRINPGVTFCYFVKPVIYGTIAAWLNRVTTRVALVAGLGYAFTDDGERPTLRRRIIRSVTRLLYALAFRLCHRIAVQNSDDMNYLIQFAGLNRNKGVLVNGSGVNLDRFPLQAPRSDQHPVSFIWTGRLLKEKGVHELVAATRIVRAEFPDTKVTIVGGVDANPGSLDKAQMIRWANDGVIVWQDKVPDVRPFLAQADVFVLPSYREGVPRSTQEAMAMGLAVITTDVPGCRETVVDRQNGFLIPVRDVSALAGAMLCYLRDPALARLHGQQSRALAEARFDVRIINAKMLELMAI